MKGEGMARQKVLVPWIFLYLTLFMSGCGTTGPQRIHLDRYSHAYRGMNVANFSMEDVDSFIRYYATQRGYEIKFADSSDSRVQQELAGNDSSLLWIAEKPGSPAIVFVSSDDLLTVSFLQVPGSVFSSETREFTNVLYAILKDKFGEENVHLGPAAASPR